MYLKYIKEEIYYVAITNPNKKVKCLVKTYYGSHNKNSDYNYAYDREIIPID